jgi:site-specific recombinase
MSVILPLGTIDIARIEVLVDLAVLPAQQAIDVVSGMRAVFQLLQDYVWETAITSVEGVLALGAFNLLLSYSLAMWVTPEVRRANLVQSIAMLKVTCARYCSVVRGIVVGPRARAVQLPAESAPRGTP